ncbi:MAG: hypothetical protein GKR99_02495 [Rhodobacteraceae bacterium]|nr:hypothetical protein [Paracoccaceae bacterium]
MRMPTILTWAICLGAGPAIAEVCVTNATESPAFFAAEVHGGARVTQTLPAGGTLCAPGDGTGVVSVFEHAEETEGCSRLVAENGSDSLIRYASFDRCEWASHSQ